MLKSDIFLTKKAYKLYTIHLNLYHKTVFKYLKKDLGS